MKLFLDTVDSSVVAKYSRMGIVTGVTTNPTLAKEQGDYKSIALAMAELVTDVSIEVTAESYDDIMEQAQEILSWHSHMTVKLPFTESGLQACKTLSQKGARVNLTLLFSVTQALLAAEAGATYASIFVGRLDDTGEDGVKIVENANRAVKETQYKTSILAASIRNAEKLELLIARDACDIVTVPPQVLDHVFHNPLTQKGLQKFIEDGKNIRFS